MLLITNIVQYFTSGKGKVNDAVYVTSTKHLLKYFFQAVRFDSYVQFDSFRGQKT